MKYLSLLALACSSFAFVSCDGVSSTAMKSSSGGIHSRSINSRSVANTSNSSFGSTSSDGFLPAEVSAATVSKASGLSRDKHGMPTYPDNMRRRVVRTTAYSHEECEVGAPWRMNAIGTYLKYGQVRSAAADWSRYPVGTKFKIKGLPYTYVVDDYGSALVGTNTIDIYHPNLSSMRRWATRKAEISVIQWGDWDRTLNILAGRRGYAHTRQMYYAAKAKVDSGRYARN